MISTAHSDLDVRIMRIIDEGRTGATAWFIAKQLKIHRGQVSDRLRSMKRRGLVICGPAAVWARPRKASA